jgi:hypothetical protein
MTAQDPANGLACAGDEAAGEVATALERARGPRELRASMDALERAAAAPAPHRLEQWAMTVHNALADMAAAPPRHGPDG